MPRVHYVGHGPRWRRLTPAYLRSRRRAMRVARALAADPAYQTKMDAALSRLRSGEDQPVDGIALLNSYRVKYGLRDRNPMPAFRLFRWLP